MVLFLDAAQVEVCHDLAKQSWLVWLQLLEKVLCRWSQRRIYLKHCVEKLLHLGGSIRRDVMWAVRNPAQQEVLDASAKAVDVSSGRLRQTIAHVLHVHNLRCCIFSGACRVIRTFMLICCIPEIADPDLSTRTHQEVGWLEIPMNDAGRMQVYQGLTSLMCPLQRLRLACWPSAHVVHQVLAAQVKKQEEAAFRLHELTQAHDIWCITMQLEELHLLLQSVQDHPLLQRQLVHNLQREKFVCHAVAHLVDHGEGAEAKLVLKLIGRSKLCWQLVQFP
mmetsp:Transcript_22060/g.50403  ORF Transcript_22060/g.50403 Transcript_22060/m.50403 type:complete len:278 (+) Transcript_22060:307-1140(+)